MTNILAMILALSLPGLATAHHSFAAEYDANKAVTLSGKVTKVEWMNPHARFYIDVTSPDGKIANWEFELGSPNGLMRAGWTRNSLKIGEAIVVEAFAAKDGTNLGNAQRVRFADGRRLFTASSGPQGPGQ